MQQQHASERSDASRTLSFEGFQSLDPHRLLGPLGSSPFSSTSPIAEPDVIPLTKRHSSHGSSVASASQMPQSQVQAARPAFPSYDSWDECVLAKLVIAYRAQSFAQQPVISSPQNSPTSIALEFEDIPRGESSTNGNKAYRNEAIVRVANEHLVRHFVSIKHQQPRYDGALMIPHANSGIGASFIHIFRFSSDHIRAFFNPCVFFPSFVPLCIELHLFVYFVCCWCMTGLAQCHDKNPSSW